MTCKEHASLSYVAVMARDRPPIGPAGSGGATSWQLRRSISSRRLRASKRSCTGIAA